MQDYDPRFWYYEVVELVRKFLLTSAVLLLLPGSSSQIAIALLIAMVTAMSMLVRPCGYSRAPVVNPFCARTMAFGVWNYGARAQMGGGRRICRFQPLCVWGGGCGELLCMYAFNWVKVPKVALACALRLGLGLMLPLGTAGGGGRGGGGCGGCFGCVGRRCCSIRRPRRAPVGGHGFSRLSIRLCFCAGAATYGDSH